MELQVVLYELIPAGAMQPGYNVQLPCQCMPICLNISIVFGPSPFANSRFSPYNRQSLNY